MRKAVFIFVCVALLIAMTACGNGSTISSGSDTFTWWMYSQANDWYSSYNDNAVTKYLENRFNVRFIFEEPVSGTETDALSLMMGTGQYTDVMNLSQYAGSHTELYDDGIIIDFAQYLDYMPNMKNLIENNPWFAQGAYTDNGLILSFPTYSDDTNPAWVGLVYRRDILDTMTGGNVRFPSGNAEPTTLADWEYMLPLFKAYFEAAGMVEFAPLLIPASGFFHYGDLMSTFGAYYTFYLRDNVIHAGILERPMYDYVAKMREWYAAGYIYRDFASRVQDMFFMPNPALTYGGAAGIWYGMAMNLGDRMSMPEHGLFFDVRGITSPMAPGITYRDMFAQYPSLFEPGFGNAVSTKCKDIEKLLSILDLFYSEEGGMLRTYGLRKEQIPPGYTVYDRMGLSDGTHWFDDSGNMIFNPRLDDVGGPIDRERASGLRFPGFNMISYANRLSDEETRNARRAWAAQQAESETFGLPDRLFYSTAESVIMSNNNARISDLVNEMIPKFIMGAEPLNETTWANFINRLRGFGIEENLAIHQAAYNRFIVRGR
jgi:putative aldouronate transport system substrate-binding protein